MPNEGGSQNPDGIPDAQSPPLQLSEKVGFYIEIWKKTVDVQQHFNDIQWRIRGLALTVATFTFGAASLAAKDGIRIGFLSLGGTLSLVGLLLWYGFYFVDRYWYHVFLKASVSQGLSLEEAISRHLSESGLAGKISSDSSSVYPGFLASNTYRWVQSLRTRTMVPAHPKMDSTKRLNWFYAVGSAPFVLVATILQIATLISMVQEQPTALNPIEASPGYESDQDATSDSSVEERSPTSSTYSRLTDLPDK